LPDDEHNDVTFQSNTKMGIWRGAMSVLWEVLPICHKNIDAVLEKVNTAFKYN